MSALNASLAALNGPDILDLPEKDARDDATKIAAVLRWLETNPTWLMILDNVDDKNAIAAVSQLLPRLKGGHVIVTARATNFSAGFRKLELDVLSEDAATQFLLERTEATAARLKTMRRWREHWRGNSAVSRSGLEQAGAHIGTDDWLCALSEALGRARDKALAWADAMVTGSERTLATVWTASVEGLSPESRRLFDRLAFVALDPIPIPSSTLWFPAKARSTDALQARAGLYAYSLARAPRARRARRALSFIGSSRISPAGR